MSLARCSRCESLYRADCATDACRYHSGVYRAWWSCCRERDSSASGCCRGQHIEDTLATALLDSFCPPAQAEAPASEPPLVIIGPGGELNVGEAVVITVPEEAEEAAASPPADAAPPASDAAAGGGGLRTVPVPVVVGPHDTWAAICLRHRMSDAELMRLNSLRVKRARVGDVLLVWAERSDAEQSEDWRRTLVRQFRRRCGTSAAEAVYYLESHAYSYEEAVAERRHDLAFDHEHSLLVESVAASVEAERAAKRAAMAHDGPLGPCPDGPESPPHRREPPPPLLGACMQCAKSVGGKCVV